MGFLDRFRKTKEQTEKQVNEKTDQKTTVETKTTGENRGHIRAEYHEVLYSQDYTGKKRIRFLQLLQGGSGRTYRMWRKRLIDCLLRKKRKLFQQRL